MIDKGDFKNLTVEYLRLSPRSGAALCYCITEGIRIACAENTKVIIVHNDKEYVINPTALMQYVIDN